MDVTILGSSASYAAAGQACSGYLVRHGDVSLLFDCGHGVVANLARVMDPTDLDGLVVSHAHPDHVVDIYALQALLRYAPDGPRPELGLWGPAGLLERLSCLLSERGGEELVRAFESFDLGDTTSFTVGDVRVTAHRVDHTAASFAFTVEAGDARLVYTGDARAGAGLAHIVAGADVLLADATLPERYAGRAPHMTASEAGALATEAAVGTLVLTHIWPTNDRDEMLRAARTGFDGEVVLAQEMLEIAVG